MTILSLLYHGTLNIVCEPADNDKSSAALSDISELARDIELRFFNVKKVALFEANLWYL